MFDSVIAKEGQKFVLVSFIAMVISILIECGLLVLITFVLTLFFIYIFRNSSIKFNNMNSDIVSPISGKVTAIDSLNGKKEIYIDVSLCNKHILRASEDGDCKVRYKRGINLSLNSFKAKYLNEKATIQFKNSLIELYSSMCNIPMSISKQNNLRKGEKIGVFLQGEVKVVVDTTNDIVVKIDDNVEAGISTLAILPTDENINESE